MTTDPTAQSTPTPAPVAVPEGGLAEAVEEMGRALFPAWDDMFGERPMWRRDIREGLLAVLPHLAPRPEPVTAPCAHRGDRSVSLLGVECMDCGARRPLNSAWPTEPVTAPLPSERDRLVSIIGDHWPSSRGRGPVSCACDGETWGAGHVADALLAAGYTLPAADQRARDEGTVREELRDLAQRWVDEDDLTQWGDHARNHCGRAVLEILDGTR